jgi:hypothetical protein
MGNFKEHGLMLYLSPPLYLGFIKLQADKGLGRSYAGLLAFTEGIHALGYISDEDYEIHKRRYSRGLNEQEEKPFTLEQIRTKTEREKMQKTFSMVLDQWADHPAKTWRSGWIKKAKEWKDKIPNAELVLALANADNKTDVVRRVDSMESLKREVEG